MGFFGGLGKVLSGKPIFDPDDQSAQSADSQQQVQGPQPSFGGQSVEQGAPQDAQRVIPVVRFGRIECHLDGQRMDIYADTQNVSEVPVFVEWVTLYGIRRQVDVQLHPGENRQLIIYSGQPFSNQPTGYCEAQYRIAEQGNYFIDYHEIRSEQDNDIGFRITELIQRGPVKVV